MEADSEAKAEIKEEAGGPAVSVSSSTHPTQTGRRSFLFQFPSAHCLYLFGPAFFSPLHDLMTQTLLHDENKTVKERNWFLSAAL